MQIRGTPNIQTTPQVNISNKTPTIDRQSAAAQIDTNDQVEISSEAQMLSELNETSGIRAERVAEIRQQIETGQYESTEKLDAAVERMLDELA